LTALQAAFLGLLQGLTEFLPVSSTAHLTLVARFLGLIDAEHVESWTSFLAVVQLGTLAAVLIYFFRDLISVTTKAAIEVRNQGVTRNLLRSSPDVRLLCSLLIGTIPIGLAGVASSGLLHGAITKNLMVISASLIVLALLLWIAEKTARHARDMDAITFVDALVIGLAQMLALIPGSSRSGTTITAGLFLNLKRHAAARFSFLLSVPAVTASGVHELLSLTADPFRFGVANLIIATLVSAISGYAAIAWLLKFLMNRTTMVFVWYRLGLGVIILLMISIGMVEP